MSEQQRKQISHGRKHYYLVGEGYRPNHLEVTASITVHNMPSSFTIKAETITLPPEEPLEFRFGRMFNKTNVNLDEEGLIKLGKAMIQEAGFKEASKHLPSGYTFLGQFIDHDMTYDGRKEININGVDVTTLVSKRSPSLDLDSLYGQLFLDNSISFDPRLYEADGIRLKIGSTSMATSMRLKETFQSGPYDLPRNNDRTALIGDDRNEENLAVAQTHLAFLKFHNAVVAHLENKVPAGKLFDTARELVVRHYQWIILHDFLPQILDETILRKALERVANDEESNWLKNEIPYMPIEFSVAAFRFGHSILQDAYEWNRAFESSDDPDKDSIATLGDLFRFTARGNMESAPTLPATWPIDWTRFYDFNLYNIPHPGKFNTSRKIDPFIGNHLVSIPEFINQSAAMKNLAIRNLLRGLELGLPTGQEVIAELGGKLEKEQILSEEEILEGPHRKILEDAGFGRQTPLWYFILKEAEVKGKGEHLGPVGSYIIAETFVTLIQKSTISVLRDDWTPMSEPNRIAPDNNPKGFEMADLLKFADSFEPLLNPLG